MDVTQWLSTFGYGAVLFGVATESTGIPFPGETMLLVAAIAAGTAHQLDIFWVIAAAASGAVLGDQLGYWLGATGEHVCCCAMPASCAGSSANSNSA